MNRWPLYPRPYKYETIDNYLRRLANCYCMGYRCFCKQALELSPSEILKFDANELPLEALKRLSAGTGISIRQLNLMKYHNVWKRLKKALEKAIESDGIKAPRPIIID